MIKAGMWQAGTHIDLATELFIKCHMAFGGTHLEAELPWDLWNSLLLAFCSAVSEL